MREKAERSQPVVDRDHDGALGRELGAVVVAGAVLREAAAVDPDGATASVPFHFAAGPVRSSLCGRARAAPWHATSARPTRVARGHTRDLHWREESPEARLWTRKLSHKMKGGNFDVRLGTQLAR